VITRLAQQEQAVSAATCLDYDQQQSPLSNLLMEMPWQVERAGGKDGAVVGSCIRRSIAPISFDYLDVSDSKRRHCFRRSFGHLWNNFKACDLSIRPDEGRLLEILDRWLRLGMPAAACLDLKVYPIPEDVDRIGRDNFAIAHITRRNYLPSQGSTKLRNVCPPEVLNLHRNAQRHFSTQSCSSILNAEDIGYRPGHRQPSRALAK
jgi:hypothetical protein